MWSSLGEAGVGKRGVSVLSPGQQIQERTSLKGYLWGKVVFTHTSHIYHPLFLRGYVA